MRPSRASDTFQSTLPARGATTPELEVMQDLAFQSTLPARGATSSRRWCWMRRTDFNPRSPHGERHGNGLIVHSLFQFQSTLPARGATVRLYQEMFGLDAFQSTLPARGATQNLDWAYKSIKISIHAPRTGSDTIKVKLRNLRFIFQSTLPARGATALRINPAFNWS